jgi:hypothetical protein
MSTQHTSEPEPVPVTEQHADLWAICDFLVWLFTGRLLPRPRRIVGNP